MANSFAEGNFCHYLSPVGTIFIATTDHGICKLNFSEKNAPDKCIKADEAKSLHPFLQLLILELDNYFAGTLKSFSVPIDPQGTDFQKKVWQSVAAIPYGEKVSYTQLSDRLNQPDAIRAVANSNARNPLLIIVPCHRVIGANGSLTGYAAGLPRKKFLLELEGALNQLSLTF
jgi:methylated-DNA-[protein]-cysteine S-methyltransferase